MADLSVTFLGMRFNNPVLLASGYPVGHGSGLLLRRFAESGAGGIIARSVFVDKVEPARNLRPKYAFGEGSSKNVIHLASVYETGSEFFLRQAPQAYVEGVPLIASIIGRSLEDYRVLGSMAEECKFVDMVEVNVSCPGTSDFGMHFGDSRPNLSQQPDLVAEILRTVHNVTSKPIVAKVSALADNLGVTSKAAVAGGADAIAAINTMPNALSGIDIETGRPHLPVIGLQGGSGLKPMALGAVVQIRRAVDVPVIGVGGIWTWQDAVEFIMAGASIVGVCSAAIYWGPAIMNRLSSGIAKFMDRKDFKSISQMCGVALPNIHSLSDLPDLKFQPRINKETCTLCRRCEETCPFGAIEMEPAPQVDLERCDGCGICLAVCPPQNKRQKDGSTVVLKPLTVGT